MPRHSIALLALILAAIAFAPTLAQPQTQPGGAQRSSEPTRESLHDPIVDPQLSPEAQAVRLAWLLDRPVEACAFGQLHPYDQWRIVDACTFNEAMPLPPYAPGRQGDTIRDRMMASLRDPIEWMFERGEVPPSEWLSMAPMDRDALIGVMFKATQGGTHASPVGGPRTLWTRIDYAVRNASPDGVLFDIIDAALSE